MSDLISRESLKQRINLNYNIHQYIDAQSIKDIINTEPSVEDKTVEKLNKIKAEIKQNQNLYYYNNKTDTYEAIFKTDTVLKVIDNHIEELKGD